MIAAANEATRVQRSLECEVVALQQTMLSMQNQSQINSSAISGYQEGALWANHWLKRTGRISASLVLSWFIMLSKKYSGCKVVLSSDDVSNTMFFVFQMSTFVFDEVLMLSNIYLNLESSQALL